MNRPFLKGNRGKHGSEPPNICWWYTCVLSLLQWPSTLFEYLLQLCCWTWKCFQLQKDSRCSFSSKSIKGMLHQFFTWMTEVLSLLNKSDIFMCHFMPHWHDIHRQVKTLYCAENKPIGTFSQCSIKIKNTLFRVYCMPANCGVSTHGAKRHSTAYNNAYHIRILHLQEMNVFAHIKLPILSEHLMPWHVTICILLFRGAQTAAVHM